MKAPLILKKGNILVNEDKTEYTILKRGKKGTENWGNVKQLGSRR